MLLIIRRIGYAYYDDVHPSGDGFFSITFSAKFYVNGPNVAGSYRWFGVRLCI